MSDFVQCETIGTVGVVRVNNPPVNALSPGVPEAILSAVSAFAADQAITAIVLAGAGRTFVAGADIRELQQMAAGEKKFDDSLQRFLDHLEATPKPLIAAIHGTALGGGLETAMACHWRIADRQAMLGQPEVDLGLIPGAAGTQRLPRLVGVVTAARLCAFGRPLTAEEAVAIQLIDQVCDGDIVERAVEFAQSVASVPFKGRCTSHLQDRLGDPEDNSHALEQLRDEVAAKRPGESAPQLVIEAVASAATLPFDAGCQHELRLFDECISGAQAKAMIRAFFGVRKAAMNVSVPPDKAAQPWQHLVVVHGPECSPAMPFAAFDRLANGPLDVRTLSLDDATSRSTSLPDNSAVLLVPSVDIELDADRQYQQFQGQVSAARHVAADAPLLVLLPEVTDAQTFLSTAATDQLIWIGFSTCGGPTCEVFAGPGINATAIDQLVVTLKQLRMQGFRRNQLGPSAISVLHHAARQAANQLIEQGIPRSKVVKALNRVGFRCDLSLADSRSGEPVKLAASKIVTSCVHAMTAAARQLQASQAFASDLELDMLAIASGLYPSYRGGPCWEQTSRG